MIAAAVSRQEAQQQQQQQEQQEQQEQQQEQQQESGCYIQLYETNGEAHGCIPRQQLSPHFDGA